MAFEVVEQAIGRKLSRGTVVEYFNSWPESGRICLKYGPICNVESIEQSDKNGCFTELNLTDFEWHTDSSQPWLRTKCGSCPDCPCGCPPRYRITYTAGPTKCEIPARARMLMLLLIQTANNYRGSDTEANLRQSPVFDRLVNSLKKPTVCVI